MPARRGAQRGKPCPPPPAGMLRDRPWLIPCSSPQDPAGTCRACPSGTFSLGNASCAAHTQCRAGNRVLVDTSAHGTSGSCFPGAHPGCGAPGEAGFNPNKAPARLIPCLPAGRRRARSPEMPGRAPGTNGTRVTLLGEEEEEAAAAQAAVLTIVPVFCAMGLLGILVCNLLKKRGYHCTASKEPQPSPSSIYQLEDANEDTIGVLVRLITEKKENAAALEELLKEHQRQQLMPPSCAALGTPHGGTTPTLMHLHTVQGPAPCARCSQKWPEALPSTPSMCVPSAGGQADVMLPNRFRVSRIPEVRSEAGAEFGLGSDSHGWVTLSGSCHLGWCKGPIQAHLWSIPCPPQQAPGLGAASGVSASPKDPVEGVEDAGHCVKASPSQSCEVLEVAAQLLLLPPRCPTAAQQIQRLARLVRRILCP
uniref:RELT TNF receptor n=1 Tax=Catharus ustulatus TaxID=91951 RepID=A0A8C3UB04_CATUS